MNTPITPEALIEMGFVDPKNELPPRSEGLKYFSIPIMILIGKRKYKGSYSYHHNKFYKNGFDLDYYGWDIEKVNGWKAL